ncbi:MULTISPECIES: tail fiber domain-containing protein [Stenotrophomonas]|uniref:Tail fiber domain-containing protein n=1 Tax=Stenotrophomonas lactitubi TaxID=2045214 RepID=A0AAW4GAN6_9GAMM|nr:MULTISPECIES: tail fiber domain-containing protein [Stenotrophomonas]MBM9911906.1 tail fiber domain-containing protein [Stenotrophomonas lactitubi]MBM9921056.1 tail fiber domain-containing protein [Stenotrophomonas lactitubi]MBM9939881.1 tail fiber domain-containing protein [Stenotrophomonas lactitubi]NYU00905.1 tail fiber domain-containing protein [Stenotrophomonas sp. SbOxS2]
MVDVKISALPGADALTGNELLAGLQGTKNVKVLVSAIRAGLLNVEGMDPPANDQSIYYTGTAWDTYIVTPVGRTFLAASTQAAQRAAIQAVGLAGDETVDGYKTWNSQHTWNLSATGQITYGQPGGSSTGITLFYGAMNARRRTDIRARDVDVLIGCASTNEAQPTQFLSIAHSNVKPNVTNVVSLGLPSNLWTQLFAGNTTISSSDARLKTEPRQLREAEFKAGSAISRLPAVWRWLSRVNGDGCEPEGKEARKHIGPTVQAVMAVMEANGLDPFSYSFICYDEWEAEPEQWHEWPAKDAVLGDNDEVLEPAVEAGRELVQPAREAGNQYSFRKEEMLCFMVSALAAENDALVAKVDALDTRLAAIEFGK